MCVCETGPKIDNRPTAMFPKTIEPHKANTSKDQLPVKSNHI